MKRPPARRILALWFPRLAAERVLRQMPMELPFAVIGTSGQAQHLASLCPRAEAAGLRRNMALADARAVCPELATRPADPLAEAAFLAALRRWAGRFSPWVGQEGTASLLLDISGVAHLFGSEDGLARTVQEEAEALGLSARLGIADTPGAAWALARFAGAGPVPARSGDAIDQEAPATRARARKRRGWERGGPAPTAPAGDVRTTRIAPVGQTLSALAPLPVAALRPDPEAIEGLARLGLRQIADLVGMPRGALARRFGVGLVRRLDQALGAEPEPVSPVGAAPVFALRLTLPEPIGLMSDIEAGLNRLLPPLCARLEAEAMGARRVRLELRRTDHSLAVIEVALARPGRDPGRIAPLLVMKLDGLEAGFGFDMLRLAASAVEPLAPRQHKGGLEAEAEARARLKAGGGESFDALLGRLGTRVGLERLIRLQPADSHIPEKAAIRAAAAFSPPVENWPAPPAPRPMVLFDPEPARVEGGRPPVRLYWRRRWHGVAHVEGPERIAPEWWLDDPAWRSGPRDYWRVEAESGTRLWLFEARGGEMRGGWFVQGLFG